MVLVTTTELITAQHMTPGADYIGTHEGPTETADARFTFLRAEPLPEEDPEFEGCDPLLEATIVLAGVVTLVVFSPGDLVRPRLLAAR